MEDVHKAFGKLEVLRGIDLALEEHEVVCLIGASGSGKSTLLRCVNLLEPIDSGRIVVGGDEVTGRSVDVNRVRREIGIVFQAFNLFPHMTVLENVILGPRKALGRSKAQAVAEADRLLTRFGLLDKRDEYPDRLSGGQQQRVAIVRALAMQPQLLLLDEVTSALDPELVAEVLDVIRELASGGMTMLIATHEMGFARDVARRVCFLHEGRILEEGPPEEIFSAPREERTRSSSSGSSPREGCSAGGPLSFERAAGLASRGRSLEPLDEYLVIQPTSDETETRAGLILPASAAAAAACRTGHRHRGRAPTSPASSPATRCCTPAKLATRCGSAGSRSRSSSATI